MKGSVGISAKGRRQRVTLAIVLIVVGLVVILGVPARCEGPLLLYINEQHAIRLVDALGLAMAVPAWLYLIVRVRRFAIVSLYLTVLGCIFIFRGQWYPEDKLSLILSPVLMATGIALFIAGRATLGEAHTTFPEARRLVTSGVYARIRHPIYTGLQMLFWGLSLWFGSWAGAILSFVLILPLHIWRARAEERVLEEAFGDKYVQYKVNTWF